MDKRSTLLIIAALAFALASCGGESGPVGHTPEANTSFAGSGGLE